MDADIDRTPGRVFSRRKRAACRPEASAGNVLVIHDHNCLAIRLDFFHPITAGIVGDLDDFVG